VAEGLDDGGSWMIVNWGINFEEELGLKEILLNEQKYD